MSLPPPPIQPDRSELASPQAAAAPQAIPAPTPTAPAAQLQLIVQSPMPIQAGVIVEIDALVASAGVPRPPRGPITVSAVLPADVTLLGVGNPEDWQVASVQAQDVTLVSTIPLKEANPLPLQLELQVGPNAGDAVVGLSADNGPPASVSLTVVKTEPSTPAVQLPPVQLPPVQSHSY